MNAAGRPDFSGSCRLWSLWEMLKESAEAFIELGEAIADARIIYDLESNFGAQRRLNERGIGEVHSELLRLFDLAERLKLPTSMKLLGRRLGFRDQYPQTVESFNIFVEVMKDELGTRLFFFMPAERALFYDRELATEIETAFPTSARELALAARCIAFGLFTASVFHSMRAAEIGVQALGTDLGVSFKYPITLAEWGNIIGEIEGRIAAVKSHPRSAQRDADLKFYSEAASQFRHFNNAWRIRIAHARATAEEEESVKVLNHVTDFFVTLSRRLKEPPGC